LILILRNSGARIFRNKYKLVQADRRQGDLRHPKCKNEGAQGRYRTKANH